MADRLPQLRSWVEESPDDAFSRYALAMELKKHAQTKEALEQFAELLKRNPDYHPSYFQYAAVLAQQNQADKAREVIQKGMAVTKKAGQEHAYEELEKALAELND